MKEKLYIGYTEYYLTIFDTKTDSVKWNLTYSEVSAKEHDHFGNDIKIDVCSNCGDIIVRDEKGKILIISSLVNSQIRPHLNTFKTPFIIIIATRFIKDTKNGGQIMAFLSLGYTVPGKWDSLKIHLKCLRQITLRIKHNRDVT